MRLLLINYEYPPVGAGAANATRHLADELVGLGHRVTVLTAAFGRMCGWSVEGGVQVCRCRSIRRSLRRASLIEMLSFVLSARLALPGVLARMGRPDGAIIFFALPCGALGPFLKRRFGIGYCISMRGGDVPGTERGLFWLYRLTRGVRRRILGRSLAVVANSPGLASRARSADSIDVGVIPNGVDMDFFRPRRDVGDRRHDGVRFLFVGRFRWQKNLVYALRCVSELQALTDVRVELVVVGEGPDGRALAATARELGLGDRFRPVPWCDREALRGHYWRADCLLNLSMYEGMPNTVLEAMACGLPVIVSDVEGHEMLVQDGWNGFAVPVDDHQAVVARLLAVVRHPDLRRLMGDRSRAKVEAEFSWRRMAESYVRIFEHEERDWEA